jgi:vitamin B12 transporter
VIAVPSPPAVAAEGESRLPPIQVTASRVELGIDDTLASVSVITREDIVASQAPDILELLRRVPGLDLARTGGSGASTSVFMRGTNSNHVLVLVDGVRVASVNTGGFAWEHLPIDQIERIEIVRGPRAAYWGSDALGGVISITTRSADGPTATLRAGRWERFGANATWGYADDTTRLSIAAGGETLEGFNATRPGNFSFDPDADGYDNRNLSLRASHALGSQTLGFTAYATRADIEFDQGESDARNEAISAAVRGPLADGWSHELLLGYASERLETPAFASRFTTERTQLDWIHRLELGESMRTVFGYNGLDERGGNRNTATGRDAYRKSRRNHALFASLQGDPAPFNYELALRRDDSSQFGGETTVQAAAGLAFDSGRVYASWGEGFRAPNFNELYSPGFGGSFAGNPDLEPEKSRSIELGLSLALGDNRITLAAFDTEVRNLIAFQGERFRAVNVNRADIDGLEARWERDFGTVQFAVDASWLDAVDARTGLQLLRRPKRKGGFDLGVPVGESGRFGLAWQYVSSRRDFGGNLSSYTLTDLRYQQQLGGGFTLGVRLGNAFDRDYELARGFTTPRREWLLTIAWDGSR